MVRVLHNLTKIFGDVCSPGSKLTGTSRRTSVVGFFTATPVEPEIFE